MFLRKTPEMPTRETALPGRDQPIRTAERHFVNGHPLKGPYPEGAQLAQFAMGCFWGVERMFWQVPGVWVTAVGYAGGMTPNPTYEEVCGGRTGQTETVLVVFEPNTVTYEDLLKVFWEGHDPTQGMRQGNDVGTQYRSAIFYYDEAQKAAAEASRDAYAKQLSAPRAMARSPPRSRRPGRSTSPRTTTRSTWPRTPAATAASAAPASPARSASA